MANYSHEQFGYFLTYETWQDALTLLDFQIESKKSNRYFNTLSMFYYEWLGPFTQGLCTPDYFEQRVASNLFYGFKKEYQIVDYLIPKAGLGVRVYKFFTYPARALYYAVGLYLLNVAEDFINNYFKKRSHIHSYWGGQLSLDDKTRRLNKLKSNNVYYKPYYRQFYDSVLSEKDSDRQEKVIIKLDVQNFFEEIRIATLLELIDQNTKPSEKRRAKYDVYTRAQIGVFLSFLMNSSRGIPQLDNDILSGFLGHLYLIFGDLLIDDEIRRSAKQIKEYRMYRYVDDIYIVLVFEASASLKDRDLYVTTLGSRIADLLYTNLGLRLNPKTRLFRLAQTKEFEGFVESLKKVSRDSDYYDPVSPTTPQLRIQKIFKQIKNLKQQKQVGPYFDYENQPEDDILKAVFDEDVNQLLSAPANSQTIQLAFRNFDFDLVKTSPLTLTILILKDPTTAKRYRDYLLQLDPVTTRESNLIVRYLCQTGFNDQSLIDKLSENDALRSVMALANQRTLQLDFPGYHALKAQKAIVLANQLHVVEQIRLRVISENQNSYTVALNHLLNEFHAICWLYQQPALTGVTEFKNYKAMHVEAYLASLRVAHQDCILIRNLFDRRNETQVSHPGSPELPSESISQKEYKDYLAAVGRCLEVILP